MTSLPIRDQKSDFLLTGENSVLVLIDYQPTQVNSIKSMDPEVMVRNIANVARLGKLFSIPTVLTTVNVETGKNGPTITEITDVLGSDVVPIDRTSINSWEDKELKEAVEATGRKKIIIGGLWTEACVMLPTLDALNDGYEVYPVADAIGGTSKEAHDLAVARMREAGAQPISWVMLACELQRDWARQDTAGQFADILFGEHGINSIKGE
ncbi:hydrolase [Cutibacterium sp. WCA-380-WT-3A]|uniref:Hydrolase n=1 Tax=Cutibacterium porci TaxID=2605781 RepID=A0A7K0J8N7_9ACTN|nr:hydrolase [Cutibacterium porci]MSS46309.1 hydrolase [Cutibacterium porci]